MRSATTDCLRSSADRYLSFYQLIPTRDPMLPLVVPVTTYTNPEDGAPPCGRQITDKT